MKFTDIAVEVAKGRPVDRQTAQAMSGGITYSLPQAPTQRTYDSPPEFRDIPIDPNFEDLTGRKFNWLRVLGLAAKGVDGKEVRFICRCACGKYSTHTRKSLVGNHEDRCHECCMQALLRNGMAGRCLRCSGMTSKMPMCGKCRIEVENGTR